MDSCIAGSVALKGSGADGHSQKKEINGRPYQAREHWAGSRAVRERNDSKNIIQRVCGVLCILA